MTNNIPKNFSPTAQELVKHLLDTRKRELEVLSGLTDEQMFGSQMRVFCASRKPWLVGLSFQISNFLIVRGAPKV